jgi:predicted acyl esterase
MISEQRLPGFSDLIVDRDVAARMSRPSSGGPFPVVLMRLPYDKTQAESNVTYHHPSWYAQQGYMVVVQDTRGRWRSERPRMATTP